MDIIKHVVQIIAQEIGQGRHGTDTQDIDPFCLENGVNGVVEFLAAHRLLCLTEFFYIRTKHHGDHVLISQTVIGHLNSLNGGQPVANHFLHGLLHGRIPVKPQINRESHHRGLGYSHIFPQAAGSHKRGLIVGFRNVLRNSFLPFGKGWRMFFHECQKIVIHK